MLEAPTLEHSVAAESSCRQIAAETAARMTVPYLVSDTTAAAAVCRQEYWQTTNPADCVAAASLDRMNRMTVP